MREQTACMMRVRNEARWIRQSLERTFQVAKTIVLWDDGSNDATIVEALLAVNPGLDIHEFLRCPDYPIRLSAHDREIHILDSPFRDAPVREREAVNEIRDKNLLWYYCKAQVPFEHMLCMDGDEVLSLDAIRRWPQALTYLESGVADVLTIPFIYLWDSMAQRRVDGIYGDLADGMPQLRFPRLFTITRMSETDLFDSHFSWQGTQGGFHCGSIPREKLRRADGSPFQGGHAPLAVAHYGYIDNALRQSKVEFYRKVDPNNAFEGNYNHCVGEPDQHAPGPVQFVPWEDV